MKNIWKVFSLLLEYCAEGKFETLIGIIERDKTIKIEEMKD
jgi:nitrate reductase assembly molybdenum cofactor insertion protein NarJ